MDSAHTVRLLLLEDVAHDAELARRALEAAGFVLEMQVVDNREDFTAALDRGAIDVILADHAVPGIDSPEALALSCARRPDVPFVVLSGTIGEEHAIEMLKRGAWDYVLKDRLGRLAPAVERALRDGGERAARRRAEEAADLQRAMLLRNEHLEAVAALVGGVAHELNNPLALLVGHATLLKRKVADGPLADRADKIMQAAERCARIVRSFLSLARRRSPERRRVDLRALVDETLEVLAYGLRTQGIELRTELAEGLPALEAAHPDRLRQLLVNLVINAQHALARIEGPRRLVVSAEADPAAGVVRLAVADNGPGVPAAIRSRVFEPFFTTRPQGEGTGLGLPLCRGIAQDHGGSLFLESVPGEGARFVVELPVAGQAVPRALTDEPPAAPGRPATVLVVDDEADLAGLIRDALVAAGHAADAVSTGALALERLRGGRYDLVLSDVRMPGLDGLRLCEEAQRLLPPPGFLFVTGDTLSPETAERIRVLGAPVLAKPFEIDELVGAVGRALEEREERRPGNG